jgi:hypothetical protein
VRLPLTFLLAAAVALPACGAGQEAVPAGSTESREPEAALPNVAHVVCESGRAPTVETPAVKPQRDGVHIDFVNETRKDLGFSIEDPSEGGLGAGAPPGTSTQVVDLHRGTVTIACYDDATEDGSEVPRSSLEIVDQDGVWISTRLTCSSDTAFSQTVDYIQGARGEAEPLEAARKALEHYMQPDDVVEPAGYPDTEVRIYRLVRTGDVLATVSLWDDGAGGWLPDTLTGCGELEG